AEDDAPGAWRGQEEEPARRSLSFPPKFGSWCPGVATSGRLLSSDNRPKQGHQSNGCQPKTTLHDQEEWVVLLEPETPKDVYRRREPEAEPDRQRLPGGP